MTPNATTPNAAGPTTAGSNAAGTGAGTSASLQARSGAATGPQVDAALRDPLMTYLTAMGDDELLLGHRDSEWTGLGPILEEDIAFSSMAQDEMGHAVVWYEMVAALGGSDADTLAYKRDAAAWRNAQLFELPRGDYAFSLIRQYLADLAEAVRYDALSASTDPAIANAAIRIRREEKYHLIHGRVLIQRLAQAGPDSRNRLQTALDNLWPYACGIWEAPPGEAAIADAGIVAPSDELEVTWRSAVGTFFDVCGLTLPTDTEPVVGGRRGEHGEGLDQVLDAMGTLRRLDPEATW